MKHEAISHEQLKDLPAHELGESVGRMQFNMLCAMLIGVSTKKTDAAKRREAKSLAEASLDILRDAVLKDQKQSGVVIQIDSDKFFSLHPFGYVSPMYRTNVGAIEFLHHANNVIAQVVQQAGDQALMQAANITSEPSKNSIN